MHVSIRSHHISCHLISPRKRRTNTRTHHQRAHRAILDHLRADDRGAEEGPERGGDEAGVDGGDGCQCRRALFEECAGGDELEREGDEVEDEEYSELDAACVISC